MTELVRAEAVETLVRSGLAPDLRQQSRWIELATRLAREATVYGVGVLDDRLFARPSGVAIAGAICEDVEAIARLAPLFAPRRVERLVETESESAEEGEAAPPSPPRAVVESVAPRVRVESRGLGLTEVAAACAHPELEIDAFESDPRRRWLLARSIAVFGCRNLRVHFDRADRTASKSPGGYDLLLLKGLEPAEAWEHALPLLQAAGRLLLFLPENEVGELRRHRTDAAGRPVRLEKTLVLESAPARGRAVACVGCVKVDHEAHAAA